MVQRYRLIVETATDERGNWVAYKDHFDALDAANKRAEEIEAQRVLANQEIAQLTHRLAAQERELAILREYVKASEECAAHGYGLPAATTEWRAEKTKSAGRVNVARDAYRRFKEAGDA